MEFEASKASTISDYEWKTLKIDGILYSFVITYAGVATTIDIVTYKYQQILANGRPLLAEILRKRECE